MKKQIHMALFLLGASLTFAATAKLPPPSDEAKAKAAEAAAKTAWAGKKDAFLLCKAQDKVAARYKNKGADAAKATPKGAPAPAPASTCTDPGPFVYTPPPADGTAVAAAPVAPAAPAAPAAPNPAAAPKKP